MYRWPDATADTIDLPRNPPVRQIAIPNEGENSVPLWHMVRYIRVERRIACGQRPRRLVVTAHKDTRQPIATSY